jgi:hypothetical protein
MAGAFSFKIDDSEFRSSLRQYALAMQISFAEAIKRQARLVAVNLAFQTQPFGDVKGKQQGENAVWSDLMPKEGSNKGIFKPISKYWLNEATRMKQYAPENFQRRFTNKDGNVWLSEEDQILTTKGAIKSFHQSMRTRDRKRTSMAGSYTRDIGRHKAGNRGIVDKDQVIAYVKQVQKKVGIAKAGWAHCAKQLGGSRGIPQWVTRHAGKKAIGLVTDNTNARGDEQYVLMENTVPWIDKCLNGGQLQRALDIQRDKMNTAIEIALAQAATA